MKFILTNGTVLPITSPAIDNSEIMIENGLIVSIAKKNTLIKENPDADVIDVHGGYIMPAIIEAHSHISVGSENNPNDADVNEMTDPLTPDVRVVDAYDIDDISVTESLEAGVTTTWVAPGSGNVVGGIGSIVKTWGKTFNDWIVREFAGLKMAFGENPKRVYAAKNKMPTTRMGIAAVLRKYMTEVQNYVEKKKFHFEKPEEDNKPKAPFEINPHLEIGARLLAGEYPARIHAHRAVDIVTAIRIANEFNFKCVIEHATEAIQCLEFLKENKIPVVVGPSMTARVKYELKKRTFETVGVCSRAGLITAITTDHWVIPLKYIRICAALSVKEGASPEEALAALTINPAKILGIDDILGSLEPGKHADIAVFNGNPLNIMNDTTHVFVKGELAYSRK